MGIHKLDNIAGFYNPYVGVKCLDCVKKKDWDEILEEEILTVEKVENEEIFYFCDCCKHRLPKQE
jgi:hypothetical protein